MSNTCMPKPANSLPTSRITLSITPQMKAYLETLLQTGLYGKNPAEAAESIIREELRRLVDEGRLHRVASPLNLGARGATDAQSGADQAARVRSLRREA